MPIEQHNDTIMAHVEPPIPLQGAVEVPAQTKAGSLLCEDSLAAADPAVVDMLGVQKGDKEAVIEEQPKQKTFKRKPKGQNDGVHSGECKVQSARVRAKRGLDIILDEETAEGNMAKKRRGASEITNENQNTTLDAGLQSLH